MGANRFTQQGPGGSVGWGLRPGADPSNPQPGDYIRTTQLSAPQQGLYDASTAGSTAAATAAGQRIAALPSINDGKAALEESLYNRATRFADRRFGVAEDQLRTRLINQGFAPGSEGAGNELQTFAENKDQFYDNAADNAVIGAETQFRANQDSEIQRIATLLAQGRGGIDMPQADNTGAMPFTPGADVLGATQGQFAADVERTNAINAQRAAPWQTIAGLGSAYLLGGRRRA